MTNEQIENVLHLLDRAVQQHGAYLANSFMHDESSEKDVWGCLVLTNGNETREVWVDDSGRRDVLQIAAEDGFVPVGILVHCRQEHGDGCATTTTGRTPWTFDSKRVEAAARDYLSVLSFRYKSHGRVDANTSTDFDDIIAETRRAFWKALPKSKPQ